MWMINTKANNKQTEIKVACGGLKTCEERINVYVYFHRDKRREYIQRGKSETKMEHSEAKMEFLQIKRSRKEKLNRKEKKNSKSPRK